MLLHLERKTLHPNRIWSVDDFLSESECEAWVAYAERVGFDEVQHPESRDVAFRHNGRIEFINDDVANKVFARLAWLLPTGIHKHRAVGCYNKIRLYRYRDGQRFGKHIDESFDTDKPGRSTGVTVLIYLNDEGLQGGETVFYEDHDGRNVVTSFKPKRGSLLFHGYVAHKLQIPVVD